MKLDTKLKKHAKNTTIRIINKKTSICEEKQISNIFYLFKISNNLYKRNMIWAQQLNFNLYKHRCFILFLYNFIHVNVKCIYKNGFLELVFVIFFSWKNIRYGLIVIEFYKL